ncbi:hypothetical protein [Neotabrizicola shimadae]|uniref:Uncharacterized protein n=1 Tax=Neotabrizicola shimadae TaxID=2807096 RepID=A0A8G0ZTB2_9RHOB|nr:hypothetical protein [Neotabrizicola shimadae]QYZ70069.1 hypothetical protein JO391_00555 [Neotabrizicola shimadae]
MPTPATTLSIVTPGTALCAVSLIDRRTGRPHRVNGAPLLVFTRTPDSAATDLMRGRDPDIWETRIDLIGRERLS